MSPNIPVPRELLEEIAVMMGNQRYSVGGAEMYRKVRDLLREEPNQCDGCKAGMELRGDLHYDRHGRVNMTCERERYAKPRLGRVKVNVLQGGKVLASREVSPLQAGDTLNVALPVAEGRVLPNPGSPEASDTLDTLLAEYQWPANSKNAARAGWEAANRWLQLVTKTQQKPLTDERIHELIDAIDFSKMVTADDLFYMIVRAAEREHGIGEAKP